MSMPSGTPFPFPEVNASLNAASAALVACGVVLIRRGKIPAHRAAMTGAAACSAIFLVSYLTYHAMAGSTRFQGQGPIRTLYLALLISHSVLAAAIVPLVLRTLYLGIRDRRESHKRLARWTVPLWMYVSVTGVVIYWMLYRSPWS